MTNGDKFDQVFGPGQANLAIASCSWWDEKYEEPTMISLRPTPISTILFDHEETYTNCTVQVLTNTVTGDTSVGWWKNEEEE